MTNSHSSQRQAVSTPIVIVGHVDHGKSTLIGRLLYDTDSLPDGRLVQIVESSKKRGLAVEWSFLLDSLQIERDQGVTVDSTRIPFHVGKRDYVIVDAPGHRQFLRNMITGAADAEAAVLVVDAKEGVKEQTRRHAMLLRLIGIRNVIVLINKADSVDFDETILRNVEKEIRHLLEQLELSISHVIPGSARDGDNIALKSEKSPWYHGPTLLEALENIPFPPSRHELPFRMPVQDVYRFDGVRYVAGRIERGTVREGDYLIIGDQKQKAKVAEVCRWHAPHLPVAATGESIALRLEPDLVPDRGDLLFPADNKALAPLRAARLKARLFWLRKEPLHVGESFHLRLATAEYDVTVASIDAVVNLNDLSMSREDEVPADGFAEITLTASRNVLFDAFAPGMPDGRGVLVDRHQQIVGGAPIIGIGELAEGENAIHPTNSRVADHIRHNLHGHKSAVFWMTGLPGSGKSTIARSVEEGLTPKGLAVTVLDGDTVRAGLCADLGFSAEDRHENIRRVAHVAKILADSGQIVIVSLVSPTRNDREMAKKIIGDFWHEIFIDTPLQICEERDPKGLYAKAKSGSIKNFTGVSSSYEKPEHPFATLKGDGNLQDAVHEMSDLISHMCC